MKVFCCLAVLLFSTPAVAFLPCLTSTNADHQSYDRGVQTTSTRGLGYYAVGSGDFLGVDAQGYASLVESSEVVRSILAYYGDEHGFEPIDFMHVCQNRYGLLLYKENHGCIVIEFEASLWTVSKCDMDEDGMDDRWEYEELGGVGYDADDDTDGDTISNYIEYLSKTDPGDPTSTPDVGAFFSYDSLGRVKSILRTN